MQVMLTGPTGNLAIDSDPRTDGGARVTADGWTEKHGAVRIVVDLTPPQVALALEALREAEPKVDPPAGRVGRDFVRGAHARTLPILPNAADPWMHRSEGMRCATCMWYVPKADNSGNAVRVELGRCRRHSPTMNGYPVVFPHDWCGDHKLNEAAAPAAEF